MKGMLLLWGILHVHVSNQQLVVAPVGKGSRCATEGVRGKPAWEMDRKWKDWLGYWCPEQTGVHVGEWVISRCHQSFAQTLLMQLAIVMQNPA